ncbi:hypothetical protein WR25_12205 [Diploscapter pachys]|uniref:Hyccin n=1 Tax=Diploscapter pachys TaxID=2018661 RepID=A0A2A2LWN5_9BILA|nr:hypothetical protein WR25_12205 [Diploscapter pachys]
MHNFKHQPHELNMNCEQLQDFLTELIQWPDYRSTDPEVIRKFLTRTAMNTLLACNYVQCNYTDVDLVQSLIGQILAIYYKGDTLRTYALQYIPTFVSIYLLALSKKQQKSVSIFETFFLAVYNEEITTQSLPGKGVKKIVEVQVSPVQYSTNLPDLTKVETTTDIVAIKPGSMPTVYNPTGVAHYPTVERFTAETKFTVLAKLLYTVNIVVFPVSAEVVSRQSCLAALSICHSGFTFPETNFRAQVMDNEGPMEAIDDFTRKPRQQVNTAILCELLNAAYLALFSGVPHLALKAIEVIHQRAQYEMLPNVLLVTNAVRNSLLDNPLSKEKRNEILWSRNYQLDKKRKEMLMNASVRMRRMPEDIPIQPQVKEKEQSKFGELVEEGIDHLHDLKNDLKKKINLHKAGRRRKSTEPDEVELSTIKEEKFDRSFDTRDNENSASPSKSRSSTRNEDSYLQVCKHPNF